VSLVGVNNEPWKFIVLMCQMEVCFVLEVCCECFVFYGLCVFNVSSMVYASYYLLCLCLLWFVCHMFCVSDVCLCLLSPFVIC
jgi:hypothetical protein